MPYGYIVHFLDSRLYSFKYYAKYANSPQEAVKEYRLEALERGYQPNVQQVREASSKEWLYFDRHGDAWHSPNKKHGLLKKKKKS